MDITFLADKLNYLFWLYLMYDLLLHNKKQQTMVIKNISAVDDEYWIWPLLKNGVTLYWWKYG